jgi:hypothetical protein
MSPHNPSLMSPGGPCPTRSRCGIRSQVGWPCFPRETRFRNSNTCNHINVIRGGWVLRADVDSGHLCRLDKVQQARRAGMSPLGSGAQTMPVTHCVVGRVGHCRVNWGERLRSIRRSRLIPGDEITPDERRVMVRDAAQFRTGIGPGPGYGFWARPKVGPTEPSPLWGGTWQTVKSSCAPFRVQRDSWEPIDTPSP